MTSIHDCRASARRWAGRAMLCLCGVLGAYGASAQQVVTVSTNSDSHGTVYLPVRINEAIAARFFFDTGSLTYLSDAFVAAHALSVHPLKGPDGRAISLQDGTPVYAARLEIAIGEPPLHFSEEAPVIGAATLRRMGVTCDGILGVNSLRGMAVYLNCIGRRLSFVPGGNLGPAALQRLGMDGASRTGLIPADGGRCQAAVSLNELPGVPMLIDTGSEFTRVPPALARKIGGEWKTGGTIDTASGRFQVHTSWLAKVSVGGAMALDQRVLYTDQPILSFSSPLGRDFLGRFALLMDFPANRLYLRDLELGSGLNPYARRLRGDETLLPAYTVSFPYGGRTISGGDTHRYAPGQSVSIPGREGVDHVKVVRNSPTVGESRKPVEVPIVIENGAIVLEATIDRKPVRMMLDTGSVSTWLSPGAVKRLELKDTPFEAPGLLLKGVTLKSVALSRAMPEFISVTCEGFVGESPGLYRLSAGPLPNVDGVLGLDCLSGLVIGLDLEKSRLVLWPMASKEKERLRWVAEGQPPSFAAVALPLEHEVGDWYYADARLEDGQRTKLALSTGYGGGLRLPASLSGGRIEASPKPPIDGASRAAAGGENGRRRAFALGEVAFDALPAEAVPERGALCVPVLGVAALRDRRVVLDFPGKKLLIGRRNVPLAEGHHD